MAMHDIFINDVSGASLGVYMTKLPPITPAPERGDWVEIAGRDGRAWQSDYALDTTKLQLTLYVKPDADLSAVNDWIYSAERIRISPWAWEWRAAAAEAAPAYAEWLNMPGEGFTTNVTFIAQPYRYAYPATARYTVSGGTNIHNLHKSSAAPIFYITSNGSGDINFMCGRYTLLISAFTGTMKIDCEEMTATNAAGTVLMNSYITAGATVTDETGRLRRWPMLKPGSNMVQWTGGTCTVEVVPNFRDR